MGIVFLGFHSLHVDTTVLFLKAVSSWRTGVQSHPSLSPQHAGHGLAQEKELSSDPKALEMDSTPLPPLPQEEVPVPC